MSVVLACDLGGTSLRAALVDREGDVLAQRAIASVPVSVDARGGSEVDADDWWRAFVAVAGELAADAPERFRQVRAVAICGITRTQVLLGNDGRLLRPAMTWQDARAEAMLGELAGRLPGAHPETKQVSAFHPVARLAWLHRHEAHTLGGLTTVLDPKDYLNFRLTGEKASDRISMARLIAASEPWPPAPDLLTAIGVPRAILPRIVDPRERIGSILGDAPEPLNRLAGVPVLCGSNDTWSAVVGLGALRPGHAYNISGTTEVFGVLSAEPAEADGLVTLDWGGVHQLGGPGQNGAGTLAWLLSLLGPAGANAPPVGEAIAALLARERHEQPLLFLPYLQGERVPHWDPDLRGAFAGLGRGHTAADMAWAVLEGVAFHNRLVLGRAEQALGRPVQEIRFGGGGASNPVWCQIKADVCERPVVAAASSEAGILGAAALAWTGLGAFASLADAQQCLVRIARRYEPDADRAAFYRPLFDLFERTGRALAPVSHELVALGRALMKSRAE